MFLRLTRSILALALFTPAILSAKQAKAVDFCEVLAWQIQLAVQADSVSTKCSETAIEVNYEFTSIGRGTTSISDIKAIEHTLAKAADFLVPETVTTASFFSQLLLSEEQGEAVSLSEDGNIDTSIQSWPEIQTPENTTLVSYQLVF